MPLLILPTYNEVHLDEFVLHDEVQCKVFSEIMYGYRQYKQNFLLEP